jgi:hypothetical protein
MELLTGLPPTLAGQTFTLQGPGVFDRAQGVLWRVRVGARPPQNADDDDDDGDTTMTTVYRPFRPVVRYHL